uniref:RanBP2-type domain-containing protein n=1 Tax=Anopheles epiroticus TaxID=199890 RepID=A0A182PS89_9DIPT
MATNPFKQAPAAVPSTTQSSHAQHSYDEPGTPAFCTNASSAAATPTTNNSGGGGTSAADSNSILKQRSTCACSNISIMQLFHEMKQKYPTVPDTVVSELVTQNCHDRPACIGKLEEAVLGTPAQTTYPSQSIHSGSLKRRSGDRKLGGNRSDGSVSYSSTSSSNSSRESSVDSSRLQGAACPVMPQPQGGATMAGTNHTGYSDSRLIVGSTSANRPTSLAVRPTVATAGMGYFGATPPPPPMRPNRTAPPCPPSPPPPPPSNGPMTTSTITTTASSTAELGETVNLQVNVTVSPKAGGPLIGGQRHTSTISLQPEPPYARELAQVSSTFSGGGGSAGCPAGTGTPGGSPSSRAGATGVGGTGSSGNGGRSSTSVNLTLRQPTDGRPRTPIHIHASPLKYTAKNFNAQSGIQSKLEVTFRDGFGSFSAMRAQVPGYDPPQRELTSSPPHQQEREASGVSLPEGHSGWYNSPAAGSRVPYGMLSGFPPPLSSSSPLPNLTQAHQMRTDRRTLYDEGRIEHDGLSKEMRYQNFVVAEMAVSQQLEQKQRLSLEVERKRTQFESICREIFVLQQPLHYIDAELLDREVLLLAAEVEQLQKQVDSCDDEEARIQAAAAAATTSGTSITDGLSALSVEGGSPLMLPSSVASGGTVVNRPPRPPRPPPPRAPTQSPSRGSSGSITPGTPHHVSVGHGASPLPTPSSSSSSPCSTSSSFASNGADPLAASRLQPSVTAGPNQPWTCSLCTFQNHELMPACEVCSLPKASGSRTVTAAPAINSGEVCDGGGEGPRAAGVMLRRHHHLSVDAAAAAAAAAAVVGASVAGPSTAPPYCGIAEMPPPSFASLTEHLNSSSFPAIPPVSAHGQQQPQPSGQPQQQQQQQQTQQQTQQPNPPPLQNAQYQKSSIEC